MTILTGKTIVRVPAFPLSPHDRSSHTSPVLPDDDLHRTANPIDHPDGSITNEKIADGTIDLTKKCTYVPVNKAGDTMTGDLVIEKDTPILFLKGSSPQVQISEGQTLRFVDSLGRGLLDVSVEQVLVWNELNMGGNTISNINDVDASGSYRGGANVDQHWIPSTDAIYDLGSSTTRWRTLYAQNIQIGDLGFSEDTCPLCGKEFQVGDEVVLKVVDREGGIRTRPCHKVCPSVLRR